MSELSQPKRFNFWEFCYLSYQSGESNMAPSSRMVSSETVFGQRATEEAFTNNAVRQKIIQYVIHDNDGKINRKNVCSVRNVQKSWLKTTTKLLRYSKEPVIELKLFSGNSLNDADFVKENGKLLDQFVTRFTAAAVLPESILPFKLDLAVDYFHEENFESLMNCLTYLRYNLMEIQVLYPSDGGTMPVSFPQLRLPLLRKLSFQFSNISLPRRQRDENAPRFGDTKNGLWLIQSILNASKRLKVFSLLSSNENVVPMGFEYLRLPDTISSLQYGLPMKTKHWDIVLKNQLPNFGTFAVQQHHIEDDALFNILTAFGRTLQTFTVQRPYSGRPSPRTLLRFPVMEKLEAIQLINSNCELGPMDASALEKCLPKLKNIGLVDQTEAMLLKWIQNSKFEHVVCLGISVINEQLDRLNDNHFRSLSLELMAQVHSAFPNVRVLNLYLNVSDMNCLKYLFGNMQRMKMLRISIRGKIEVDSVDLLDSVLLGIPVRMVTVLKEDSEFLEFVLKRGKLPSIMNLAALDKLILWTEDKCFHEDGGKSLMSDLLFSQGLMKMPTLRNLYAYGRFQPSRKMQDEWKGQGRFMKYSPK